MNLGERRLEFEIVVVLQARAERIEYLARLLPRTAITNGKPNLSLYASLSAWKRSYSTFEH